MKNLSTANLKKHAAAIHCSGELSLVERKLSNILLLNAYDDLLIKDAHTIPTKHLLSMLGWGDSNNADGLKTTLKGLMSTIVEFNLMGDGGEVWQAMTLLSSATLADGECRYSYAKDLAVKFYKPEIFAVINIGVQKQFKSNYALTLYENCVRFINVGSTGWWDLSTFRKLMGANSSTYNEFKRLSSFVIKFAIKEINELSDIRLSVEYKKENRKVVALRFLVASSYQHELIESDTETIKSGDVYAELREMELFKRLRMHGIGERLALSWMIEEPDLAAKAVNYTEDLDNKGLIKGKTAGYIRRLIETRAQLDESDYEQKKIAKSSEQEQLQRQKKQQEISKKHLTDYQTFMFQQALKNLLPEQMQELKDRFLLSDEGKHLTQIVFDISKGKFTDKVTQLTFLPWLKKAITPKHNQNNFEIWLNKKV
ncbi:MAG: replication initiation protein [Methylococcales bacterium]|nr:replication initiation protein [Methylococcales bacterium]